MTDEHENGQGRNVKRCDPSYQLKVASCRQKRWNALKLAFEIFRQDQGYISHLLLNSLIQVAPQNTELVFCLFPRRIPLCQFIVMIFEEFSSQWPGKWRMSVSSMLSLAFVNKGRSRTAIKTRRRDAASTKGQKDRRKEILYNSMKVAADDNIDFFHQICVVSNYCCLTLAGFSRSSKLTP